MAQRFNADTSIVDYMNITVANGNIVYGDAISLLGVASVSVSYYSTNAVAGTLFSQFTDFDNFNGLAGGAPTRETAFAAGGTTGQSVTGPTTATYPIAATALGAKWFRLYFQASAAGTLRVAVTLKANVAS